MIQLDQSSIPSIFIGSSSEGLQVARILQSQIGTEFRAHVWNQGLFTPGSYPLEVLDNQIKTRDFAVFVCTPDDPIVKRSQETMAVRDNVIYELGLFMGAIGRERAFMLVPSQAKVELPSDLTAIAQLRYNDEQFKLSYQDQIASLQQPCLELRNAIQVNWAKIQDERRRQIIRAVADQRYKSIRRLYTVIVEMRDLIIVFPPQLLDSLSDHQRFEKVKLAATSSVDKALAAFHDDAASNSLVPELSQLGKVTKSALLGFPFPIDPSLAGMDASDALKIYAIKIAANIISKENPLANLGKTIEAELERQVNILVAKYQSWWKESHQAIMEATDKLQDALTYASLTLNERLLAGK